MQQSATRTVGDQDPLDNRSLPAWTYRDAEFHTAEMERVMRPSWQLVCHQNDVPNVGDWHTFDFLNESILVVRGEDRAARAFTNVCRHRGSRLVDGSRGCARKLVCPYHAWTYDLDGRLSGVPFRGEYDMRFEEHGLARVDLDVWRGFIFVRLAGDGPSVAEMMAPYDRDIAQYRFEDLEPLGRVTLRPRQVNWKNIADNYSDGLHIPVAHPGLTRLFGKSYSIEAETHVDKMWGDMTARPSASLSERLYQRHMPHVEHLTDDAQRQWVYYKLWPNLAFEIHPDQIGFMQFLPISATETLIRDIGYAVPDNRREMKLCRYLNWRINRQVNVEDTALVNRVQSGMSSASYSSGPLGASEVCLRSFARKMRMLIPEARLPQSPPKGWSARA